MEIPRKQLSKTGTITQLVELFRIHFFSVMMRFVSQQQIIIRSFLLIREVSSCRASEDLPTNLTSIQLHKI